MISNFARIGRRLHANYPRSGTLSQSSCDIRTVQLLLKLGFPGSPFRDSYGINERRVTNRGPELVVMNASAKAHLPYSSRGNLTLRVHPIHPAPKLIDDSPAQD